MCSGPPPAAAAPAPLPADPEEARAVKLWNLIVSGVTAPNPSIRYKDFADGMELALRFPDSDVAKMMASTTMETIGRLVRTSFAAVDANNHTTSRLVTAGCTDGVRLAGVMASSHAVFTPSGLISELLAEGSAPQLFTDTYFRTSRPLFRAFMQEIAASWLPAARAAMHEDGERAEAGAQPGAEDLVALVTAASAVAKTADDNAALLRGVAIDAPELRRDILSLLTRALNVPEAEVDALASGSGGAALLKALVSVAPASDPGAAVVRGYLCRRYFVSPKLRNRIMGVKLLASWATALQEEEEEEGGGEARSLSYAEALGLLSSGTEAERRGGFPAVASADAEADAEADADAPAVEDADAEADADAPAVEDADAEADADAGEGAAAAASSAAAEAGGSAGAGTAAAGPAAGAPPSDPLLPGSSESRDALKAAAAAATGRGRLTCECLAAWISDPSGLDFTGQLLRGSLHSSLIKISGPIVGVLARAGILGRPQLRTVFRRALSASPEEATNLRRLIVAVAANGPLPVVRWLYAFLRDQAGDNYSRTLKVVRLLADKSFRRTVGADGLSEGEAGQEGGEPGGAADGAAPASGAGGAAAAASAPPAAPGSGLGGGQADGTQDDEGKEDEGGDAAAAAAAGGRSEGGGDEAEPEPRLIKVDGVTFDRMQSAEAALDGLIFAMITHPAAPPIPALSPLADPMGARGAGGASLEEATAEATARGPFTFCLAEPAGAAEAGEGGAGGASDADDEDDDAARNDAAVLEAAEGVSELCTRFAQRFRERVSGRGALPLAILHGTLRGVAMPATAVCESLIARARSIVAAGHSERHPLVVQAARRAVAGLRLIRQNEARAAKGMRPITASAGWAMAMAIAQGVEGEPVGAEASDALLSKVARIGREAPMSDDEVERLTGHRPPPALAAGPGHDDEASAREGPRHGADVVLRALALLQRVLLEPQGTHYDIEGSTYLDHRQPLGRFASLLESKWKLAATGLGLEELVFAEAAAEAAARQDHDLSSVRGRLQAVHTLRRMNPAADASRADVIPLWSHALERTPNGRRALFEYLLCLSGGLSFLPRMVGDVGSFDQKRLCKAVFDGGHSRNELLASETMLHYGDMQPSVAHLTWFASLFRPRVAPYSATGAAVTERQGLASTLLASTEARFILSALFGPAQAPGTPAGGVAAPPPPPDDPPRAGAAGDAPGPHAIRPCPAHELGAWGTRALFSLVLVANSSPAEAEGGLPLFLKNKPNMGTVSVVGRDGCSDSRHLDALAAAFSRAFNAKEAAAVVPPNPPAGVARVPPGSTVVEVEMGNIADLSVSGMDVLRHVATHGTPDSARLASDMLFQLFLLHRPYKAKVARGEAPPQASELVALRDAFRKSVGTALSEAAPPASRAGAVRVMSRVPDAIELFLDTMEYIGEGVPPRHASTVSDTASAVTSFLGTAGGPGSSAAALEAHLSRMQAAGDDDAAEAELGAAAAAASASSAARLGPAPTLGRQTSVVPGVAQAPARPSTPLTAAKEAADNGLVFLFRAPASWELKSRLAPLPLPEFTHDDFEAVFQAMEGEGGDEAPAQPIVPPDLQLRLWHLLMRLPTSPALQEAVSAPSDADWGAILGGGGWRALYALQAAASSVKPAEPYSAAAEEASAAWSAAFVGAGGLGWSVRSLLQSSPMLHGGMHTCPSVEANPVDRVLAAAASTGGAGPSLLDPEDGRGISGADAPLIGRQASLSLTMGSDGLARRARRAVAAAATHILVRTAQLHPSGELAGALASAPGSAPGKDEAPSADDAARRLGRLGQRLVVLLSELLVDSVFEAREEGGKAPEGLLKACRAAADDVPAALWLLAKHAPADDEGAPAAAGAGRGAALGRVLLADAGGRPLVARHLLRAAFMAPTAAIRSTLIDDLIRPLLEGSPEARALLVPLALEVLGSLPPSFSGGDAIVELLVSASRSDGHGATKLLVVKMLGLLSKWRTAGPGRPDDTDAQAEESAPTAASAASAASSAAAAPAASGGSGKPVARPVVVACIKALVELVESGQLPAGERFPTMEAIDGGQGPDAVDACDVVDTLCEFVLFRALFPAEGGKGAGSGSEVDAGSHGDDAVQPLCVAAEERQSAYGLLLGVLDARRRAARDSGSKEGAAAAAKFSQDVVAQVEMLTSGGGSLVRPYSQWDFDPSSELSTGSGHAGLFNLGNTCYANSVIQQLFAVTGVREAVLSADLRVPAPRARGAEAAAAEAARLAAEKEQEELEALAAKLAAEPAPGPEAGPDASAAAEAGAGGDGPAEAGADERKEDEAPAAEPEEDEEARAARLEAEAAAKAEQEAAEKAAAEAKKRKAEAEKQRESFLHEHRILFETQRAFLWLSRTGQKAFRPEGLVDHMAVLPFERIRQQNDAGEFLRCFLGRIEGSLPSADDIARVRGALVGQTVSYVERPNCCKRTTLTTSSTHSLQLPVGPDLPTLRASLQSFIGADEISGSRCSQCGQSDVTITKRGRIRRLPGTLTLLLNRNGFDPETLQQRKINDELRFPERIDMARFTDWADDDAADFAAKADEQEGVEPARPATTGGPDVYELTGVVVHRGTHQSGHYISYVKVPIKAGSAESGGSPAAAPASASSGGAAERPDGGAAGAVGRRWMLFDDERVRPATTEELFLDAYGGKRTTMVKTSDYRQIRTAKVSESRSSAVLLFYTRASPESEGARLGNERFLRGLGREVEESVEFSDSVRRRERLEEAAEAAAAAGAHDDPRRGSSSGATSAAGEAAGRPEDDLVLPADRFEFVPSRELLREESQAIAQANKDARVVGFRFDAALAGFLADVQPTLPAAVVPHATRGAVAFVFDTLMRCKDMAGPDAGRLVDRLVGRIQRPGPEGADLARFVARFLVSVPAAPGSTTPPSVLRDGFPAPAMDPVQPVAEHMEAAAAEAVVSGGNRAQLSGADISGLAAEARGTAAVAAALARWPGLPAHLLLAWRHKAQARLVETAARISTSGAVAPEDTAAAVSGAAVSAPLPSDVLAALDVDVAAVLEPEAAAGLEAGLGPAQPLVRALPEGAPAPMPGLAGSTEARKSGFDRIWLSAVLRDNSHAAPRRLFTDLAVAALRRASDDEAEAAAASRDLEFLGALMVVRSLAADASAGVKAAQADAAAAVRTRSAANRAITASVHSAVEASASPKSVAARRVVKGLGILDQAHVDTIKAACTGTLQQNDQLREIMPDATERQTILATGEHSVHAYINIAYKAKNNAVGRKICARARAAVNEKESDRRAPYAAQDAAELLALCEAATRVFAGATMDDINPDKEPATAAGAAPAEAKEAEGAAVEPPAASPELLSALHTAEAEHRRCKARIAAATAAASVLRAAQTSMEGAMPLMQSLVGTAAAALVRPLRSTAAFARSSKHWPEFFRVFGAVMDAAWPEGAPPVQWPPAQAGPLAEALATEADAVRRAVFLHEMRAEAESGGGTTHGARGRRVGAALRRDEEAIAAVMRPWLDTAQAEAAVAAPDASAAAARCGLRLMPGSVDWRAAQAVAAARSGPGAPGGHPGSLILAAMGAPACLGRLITKERYTRRDPGRSGSLAYVDTRPAIDALRRMSTRLALPDPELFAPLVAKYAAADWLWVMQLAGAKSLAASVPSFHQEGARLTTELLLLLTRVSDARKRAAIDESGGSVVLPPSVFEGPPLSARARSAPPPPPRGPAVPLANELADVDDNAANDPDYEPDSDTDGDADSQHAVNGNNDAGSDDDFDLSATGPPPEIGDTTGTEMSDLGPGGFVRPAALRPHEGPGVTPNERAASAAAASSSFADGGGETGAGEDAAGDAEAGAGAAAAASASAAGAAGPEEEESDEAAEAGVDEHGMTAAERADAAFLRFEEGRRTIVGPPSDPALSGMPTHALRAVCSKLKERRTAAPGLAAALVTWVARLDEVGPGARRAAVRAMLRSAEPLNPEAAAPGAGLLDLPFAPLLNGKPGIEYEAGVNRPDMPRFHHGRGLASANGANAADLFVALLALDAASTGAEDAIGHGTMRTLPPFALSDVRAELSRPDVAPWWDAGFAVLAPWRHSKGSVPKSPWFAGYLADAAEEERRDCRRLSLPKLDSHAFYAPRGYADAPTGPRHACATVSAAAALLRAHAAVCREIRRRADATPESAAMARDEARAALDDARARFEATGLVGMVGPEDAAAAGAAGGDGGDPFAAPTWAELQRAHEEADDSAAFALGVHAAAELPSGSVPAGLRAGLIPAGRRPRDLQRLAPPRVTLHPATDEPTEPMASASGASGAAAAAGEGEAGAGAAAAASASSAAPVAPAAGLSRMVEGVAAVPGGPACGAEAWAAARAGQSEAFGAGIGSAASGVPAGWYATSDDTEDEQHAHPGSEALPPLRPGHVRRPLRRDAVAAVITDCGFPRANGVYVARRPELKTGHPVLEKRSGRRAEMCLWREGKLGKEWCLGVPQDRSVDHKRIAIAAFTEARADGLPDKGTAWVVPATARAESCVLFSRVRFRTPAGEGKAVARYFRVAQGQFRDVLDGAPAVAPVGDPVELRVRARDFSGVVARDTEILRRRKGRRDATLAAANIARRRRVIGPSDPVVARATPKPRNPPAAAAAGSGPRVGVTGTGAGAGTSRAGRPAGRRRAGTPARGRAPNGVTPLELPPNDPSAGPAIGPAPAPGSTAITVARPADAEALIANVTGATGCDAAKAEAELVKHSWNANEAVLALIADG